MREKPRVTKRGTWRIQLPAYGFHKATEIAGFRTQLSAYRYALNWVATHGGGTVNVLRQTTPEPPGFMAGRRVMWRPVIR